MTAAGVPAPLVRAFRDELAVDGPGGRRRRFLRHLADQAVGPAPAGDHGGSPDGSPSGPSVAIEDGVALALAVGDAVAGAGDPRTQEPLAPAVTGPARPSPEQGQLSGAAAARELGRRLRRLPRRVAARGRRG